MDSKLKRILASVQKPARYTANPEPLYDISYNDDGTVSAITPRDGAPEVVSVRRSMRTALNE